VHGNKTWKNINLYNWCPFPHRTALLAIVRGPRSFPELTLKALSLSLLFGTQCSKTAREQRYSTQSHSIHQVQALNFERPAQINQKKEQDVRHETALVSTIHNYCSSDEHEPPMTLIPRLVSGLALRVAIWCCKLCMRVMPSPAQIGEPVSDCPDEGRIAVALLDYQMRCRCKSCLSEIIMTALRVDHLYRNPPCGDVEPEK
jgi:hypothetical protein